MTGNDLTSIVTESSEMSTILPLKVSTNHLICVSKQKTKLINKQNQIPDAQVQANKNKIYKQHPEITKHVPRCGFEDLRALLTASTHVLPVVHGKDLLPSPKFT
jgi:hypothetical protein